MRLVNYCSGLCMPEIAAMGALERLDMMLNDALYGIIFRDINPLRTLIDQNFSRRINAVAGVVINTGEDNYLTTADAVEQAPGRARLAVHQRAPGEGRRASRTGRSASATPSRSTRSSRTASSTRSRRREAAREIFPDAPLKYMPPTKHMTGNVFRGYQQNTLFVLTSVATGQSIHLLGMLTEALHTPFLHDRWLAIDQAKTIRRERAAPRRGDPVRAGRPHRRAARSEVLAGAEAHPRDASPAQGLFAALSAGVFADTRRRMRRRPRLRRRRARATRPTRTRSCEAWTGSPPRRARVSAARDARAVRPYGDKKNDGAVQVSFTLPIAELRRRHGGRQALRRRRWASASPT